MFQDYRIACCKDAVKLREVRRLNFLREYSALGMYHAARKVPGAAMVAQFDVTPLVEYLTRDDEDDPKKPRAKKPRPLDMDIVRRAGQRNLPAFFLKALAHTLHHVPALNGFFDYAPWRGGALYMARDINIAFTVQTRYGVLNPIVCNPHEKELSEVGEMMRALAMRARRTDPNQLFQRVAKAHLATALRRGNPRGFRALIMWLRALIAGHRMADAAFDEVPEEDRLRVEDVVGATVTLMHTGTVLPGHQTAATVVPPQVMTVSVGDLRLAPVVLDGEVVPRCVVEIGGTVDYRAVDGGDIFPFHEHWRHYLTHPELIVDWKKGDPV